MRFGEPAHRLAGVEVLAGLHRVFRHIDAVSQQWV